MDNSKLYNYDYVQSILQEGICNVKFEKLDGTIREMICTLNINHIPAGTKDYSEGDTKPVNKESLAVYDLEKEAWRSFRVKNLKSLEFNVE